MKDKIANRLKPKRKNLPTTGSFCDKLQTESRNTLTEFYKPMSDLAKNTKVLNNVGIYHKVYKTLILKYFTVCQFKNLLS